MSRITQLGYFENQNHYNILILKKSKSLQNFDFQKQNHYKRVILKIEIIANNELLKSRLKSSDLGNNF